MIGFERVQQTWAVTTSPNYKDIFKLLKNTNLNGSVEQAMKSAIDYNDRHVQVNTILIILIYKNLQPFEEKQMRLDVYKKLRNAIEPYIRSGEHIGFLAMGGSTLSRLATRGADLDLCFSVRCTNGEYDEE